MAKNTFAVLGILAVLLLSFGLTSAATANNATLTINQSSLSNVSVGDKFSFLATVVNANTTTTEYYIEFGTSDWTWTGDKINITTGVTATGELTIPSSNPATKKVIAKFYEKTNQSNLLFKLEESVSITYASTSNTTNTTNTTTPSGTFCELNNFGKEKGHLKISALDITNNGAGDDQEWQYLDEIVIEVTVENTDDENIDDVIVELLILDDRGNTVTKKNLGLNDNEEDLGRINDDDEEVATFKISELPIDLEEGTYKLYIRAYEDGNEDNECVSKSDDFTDSAETYFEFEIKSSEDSTVIVKRDLPNVKASCGDNNVEVRFMVYNTGSDDEDQVLVTLENSKLGIYEKVIIDNLRNGKGKEAVFYISVPKEVAKSYEKLDIYTYYDYDDDEDGLDENAYGESSEDAGDDFLIQLEILSCQAPEPTITATLESTTQVGQDLVIKAKIKNEGSDSNFAISATGFESWANLVSVNPQSVSLDAGEYQEVIITLSPTTAGAQSFKIKTTADGSTYEQAVSVNIAEKSGFFGLIDSNKIVFYSVVGIAALLVLIFLVLIVRVLKRAKASQF
ncbi:MAG: putative S-layer protein [archaeon]